MKKHILTLALAGFALSLPASLPAQAAPLGITKGAIEQPDSNIEKVARVARGGAAVRGPRGGVAVRRGAVAVGPRGGAAVRRGAVAVGPRGGVAVRRGAAVGVGGAAVRRGAVVAPGVRYGGWARPAGYWWRPGGAIAAGAAIGFVTAATAAAWAGAAPGPNMCWYYTDPSRTQGFWDVCQ
ncbi:MAG TPA: hypothetical protein VKD43_06720 [Xanthobacteraceae bacterium]|nr:hypothetical protein [Xanthobacteraceae bacterium]